MNELIGKTVLITTAGQGIGRATAEIFAAQGTQVIASDIIDSTLAELDEMDRGIVGLDDQRLAVRYTR